ncbi:protein FAR-RED IMPAIRED RESPONSE 1-like [Chenopodium quinoa]|uniref:protein FAR-RED IMPAIRED RESPONSE 1-like n=1 Tax=Chenopodium quinoa TaxID=63459 RepID=UPI000B77305F|nr:protein FAR-RED IMPAIRED RESPONSE 1-like [Chenopodium quinoa]
MASKRSRTQRGESSRAQQPTVNPELQVPGWEEVVITSEEQRARMLNLIDRQVISTRFVHHPTVARLGLDKYVGKLFKVDEGLHGLRVLRVENGLWELKSVEVKHNHEIDPTNSELVKEYRMRQMTSKVKKTLTNLYEQGVPISQIHGFMATERKGNMALTVKDLQHEVYKARRLKMVGGDSVAMMEYFDKMQTGNQNFFHAQRLDEEGRLKDVLWVDARSRVAYEDFGDAVFFDATYLTNEYELLFANFVGVNHHGQSLLLGCALVSHEDCDTFAWIFRQWLACMNNRAPKAILTDQTAGMRRPLVEVMPNTVHRWCIWHIMSKIPEKLGKCAGYQEFVNPLKELVYESFDPGEFQTRWVEFIAEYKLEDNEGLQSLHKESHMWVPAYVKEFFWAVMKTTQRVESINRFFDGYVNRKTKLHEFPQKYCMALDQRV